MGWELAKAFVTVRAYSAGLKPDLDATRRTVDDAMGGIAGSISAKMGLIVSSLTAGFGVIRALSGAGQFEQTQIAFDTMLGSAEMTKQTLEDLTEFAAKTPFEMPEILQASRGLIQFGERGEEMMETLNLLGNAAAGTSTPFGFLALVFNQVRGVGKLLTQDFRQLSTRGVISLQDIADYYGVATDAAQEMLSQGRVSFEDLRNILKKLSEDGGRFANLMERQSTSMLGLWSTLKDALGIVSREIGTALMPEVKKLEVSAIAMAESMRAWVGENKELLSLLAKVIPTVVGAGVAIYSLVKAVTLLKAASLALAATNPLILALSGIAIAAGITSIALQKMAVTNAGLSDSMQKAYETAEKARTTQKEYVDTLQSLADKTQLTDEEMKRAKNSVDALNNSYKGLGISVNETTRRIEGNTGALKGVELDNEKRRLEQLKDYRKQLSENMQRLAEQLDVKSSFKKSVQDTSNPLVGVGAMFDFFSGSSRKALQEKMDEQKKMSDQVAKQIQESEKKVAAASEGIKPKTLDTNVFKELFDEAVMGKPLKFSEGLASIEGRLTELANSSGPFKEQAADALKTLQEAAGLRADLADRAGVSAEEAGEKLAKYAQTLADLKQKTQGLTVSQAGLAMAFGSLEAAAEAASDMLEGLKTPKEEFDEALARINALVNAGMIPAEKQAQLVTEAFEKFDKALGGPAEYIKDLKEQLGELDGTIDASRDKLREFQATEGVAPEQIAEMQRLLDEIDVAKFQKELQEGLETPADKAIEKFSKIQDQLSKGLIDPDLAKAAMEQIEDQMTSSLTNPIARARDEFEEYQKLYLSGVLSPEKYRKALEKIQKEMQPQMSLTGSVDIGGYRAALQQAILKGGDRELAEQRNKLLEDIRAGIAALGNKPPGAAGIAGALGGAAGAVGKDLLDVGRNIWDGILGALPPEWAGLLQPGAVAEVPQPFGAGQNPEAGPGDVAQSKDDLMELKRHTELLSTISERLARQLDTRPAYLT